MDNHYRRISVFMAAACLLVLASFGVSHSAPWLVCDVYPSSVTQPTEFEIFMDGSTTPIISPAQAISGGVRLRYDLQGVTTGNHSVTVKAVRVDAAWGRLTSASSVPFVFTRPGVPGTLTGIGLEP